MDSSLIEFLFNTDYKSYSLKPVEQLVCMRMLYLSSKGESISLSNIASACNCSKQTVYSAASKLVTLGLFNSHQNIGKMTDYEVNPDFLNLKHIALPENKPGHSSSNLNEEDLWNNFDSTNIFSNNENTDNAKDNYVSIEDAHIDTLLRQGHEPAQIVANHCVPSNSKRSKARKKRKKK